MLMFTYAPNRLHTYSYPLRQYSHHIDRFNESLFRDFKISGYLRNPHRLRIEKPQPLHKIVAVRGARVAPLNILIFPKSLQTN